MVCEDDSRTKKIDYLWNDMNNTACIGTIDLYIRWVFLFGNNGGINMRP